MPSTRDRLLDSAEVLLVEGGPRALTLDAAAAAAAVSKGGLLYHYPTKDALVDGLLDRLARRSADDVTAMRAAPDGPVGYYLRTAAPTRREGSGGPAGRDGDGLEDGDALGDGDALTRTVLAATTLASAGDARARTALAGVNDGWYAVLLEDVGDPQLARVVQLVGDGLWLAATTGSPLGDVGALTAVVRAMVARAAGAPAASRESVRPAAQ